MTMTTEIEEVFYERIGNSKYRVIYLDKDETLPVVTQKLIEKLDKIFKKVKDE